jgi:hypothetical protein
LSPTGIPKTTHERVASSETKELAKQQGSTPPINERIFSHGITRKGEGLVAISRDGAFIAIEEDQKRSGGFFTPDIPGTVTVFETGTAARVHTRKLPKSLKSMSFSPDAKILGLLMRDKLQLLDTWSWKDVAYIDRSDLLSHCFAEDYKQVAISTWSSIYVYRLGGSGVTLDTKFKHRLNDSPTFREVHLACLKKNHVAVSIAGQSTESSYTRIHVRNYDVESGNVTWATSFEEGQPETRKFVDLRAVTAAYEWNGQKTKLRCLDSMGGTVVTTVDPFRVIGRPGPSKDWHTTLLDAVKQKRHHLALFKHFPKHHNPSPWFRIEVVDLQTGYGFFRTDIDLQSYSDTGDARLSHDLKLCLLQLKYAERPKRSGNGNQSSNVVELWRIGSSPVD